MSWSLLELLIWFIMIGVVTGTLVDRGDFG